MLPLNFSEIKPDAHDSDDSVTKPILTGYCREFGLGTSGNKDILIGRLKAFSSDSSRWDR